MGLDSAVATRPARHGAGWPMVPVLAGVAGTIAAASEVLRGFERRAGGHGFANMRDRLGAFCGVLEIESAPGAGTTVRGTVPACPEPRP